MSLPVTLIAGFLGSGKTTLVRRILTDPKSPRCAVIVNEFGALGIDGDLVARSIDTDSSVVELSNGCICCEIQDDLRTTLLALTDRVALDAGKAKSGVLRRLFGRASGQGSFEHVLVEASGAASPGPAVQTFLIDAQLAERVHLRSVVTLAHAAHVEHLLQTTVEAPDQIAYADRVVLNHADRVDADELVRLQRAIAALNPLAEVRTAEHAEVPIEGWVLAERAHDGDAGGAGVLLGARPAAPASPGSPPDPVHTRGLGSVALSSDGPIDRDALVIWLEFLAKRRGQELMRAKGILRSKGDVVIEVQGVYQWLEATERPASQADVGSRLVLIGRDLDRDEIQRGWDAIAGR